MYMLNGMKVNMKNNQLLTRGACQKANLHNGSQTPLMSNSIHANYTVEFTGTFRQDHELLEVEL